MSVTTRPIRNSVDTAMLFATIDAVRQQPEGRAVPLPYRHRMGVRNPWPRAQTRGQADTQGVR